MWLSMVHVSVGIEGYELAKTQVISISIRDMGDSFLHTAIPSKFMYKHLHLQV